MRYQEGESIPFISPVMKELQRRVADSVFGSDGKLRCFGIYNPPGPFSNQRNSFLFLAPTTPIRPISVEELNDFSNQLLDDIPNLTDSRQGSIQPEGLLLPVYNFQESVGQLSTSITSYIHLSSLSADLASREHAFLMRLVFAEEASGGRTPEDFDPDEFMRRRGEDRRDLVFGRIAPDWLQNLENDDPNPFKY